MDRPTCATCIYFYEIDEKRGECRHESAKLPPTEFLARNSSIPSDGWWPRVLKTDGCGRHPQFPKPPLQEGMGLA
jgi:hypothetical protein